MNAATNQPSIPTLRLGQSDQAGQADWRNDRPLDRCNRVLRDRPLHHLLGSQTCRPDHRSTELGGASGRHPVQPGPESKPAISTANRV